MKLEPHPIALCYPPLSEVDFCDLKESIQKNGQLNPITLYEGKVLDGTQRQRACNELGIEPKTISPQIDDPVSYVVGQNERRRHLSTTDKALIGEKLAKLRHGSNQYQKVDSSFDESTPSNRKEVAKALGISTKSIDRVRQVKRQGVPELIAALESKSVGLEPAVKIARLPKDQQLIELTKSKKALEEKFSARTSPKREDQALHGRRKPAEKPNKEPKPTASQPDSMAQADKDFLAIPNIYPSDAQIPQGPGQEETRLRAAIAELRLHDPEIPKYGKHKLEKLIYPNTQFIQAYHFNRFNHSRPEGPLDPRLLEWARNVAGRFRVQEKRKLLEGERRSRSENNNLGGFDGMWRSYWREESLLLRRFPHSYFEQIKHRWLEKTEEIFRQKQINAERLKQDRKNKKLASESRG